jgi:hypothetical protein
MFRRSLFIGLTLMLAVVLVYLVVMGRRQEKRQTLRPIEIIRESKPTLTRLLAPEDLEIVESRMEWVGAGIGAPPGGPSPITARHIIVIRNHGRLAYRNILVKLSYFGRREKLLETRAKLLEEPLQPGKSRISEITMDNLPTGIVSCPAKIQYADLEPEGGAR